MKLKIQVLKNHLFSILSVFITLSICSTTVVAQNQLVKILGDSISSLEIIDQISAATGAPQVITEGVFGGQSFIVDTTGFLTRIEITAKKVGPQQTSDLSLEIRTGSDPAMGSSLITELFEVTSDADALYSIVLTTPIPVTKGDVLVMIIKKITRADTEWQRSSTDVYAGGNAFLNASGWVTLSDQDHDFTSYVAVPDSSLVSYFSVANDGLIKVKNRITNVAFPVSANDAATRAYVDIATSIPTYTIGLWPELGGYVFWVSSDGKHGLVAETTDQSSSSNWYAAQNLISDPSSHSANGDDFRDWRLPTRYELNEMYLQAAAIGGFSSDIYWSSTENVNDDAWGKGFFIGVEGYGDKVVLNHVRAVRAF